MAGSLEGLAVAVLCTAAVIAPVMVGASGEWPRLALESAIGGVGVAWAWSGSASRWSLLLPPLVAGVLVIQLVPMPQRVLGVVAPLPAEQWKRAADTAPGISGKVAVSPSATAAGLRRLLLGLAAVTTVAALARSARWQRSFIQGMAASGVVIWCLGIAFPTTQQERMLLGFIDVKGPIDYWLTPIEPPHRTCGVGERVEIVAGPYRYTILEGRAGDVFGPYLYSNHFAGALGLTVPAIMAVVFHGLRGRSPAWVAYLATGAMAGAAVATNALIVGSRAGALAVGFGVLTFFSIVFPPGISRAVIRSVIVALAVVLLTMQLSLYGAFGDVTNLLPQAIQPAYARLQHDPRIAETQLAAKMFRSSPIVGVGLGGYAATSAVLNPGRFVSYYAHNDYAQWLAETGLVGLGIAAGCIVLLVWRLSGFMRLPITSDTPFAAAAWGSVAAIAVHSIFDWNLHLPANAFLACIAAGVAIASGVKVSADRPAGDMWRGSGTVIPRIVFTASCVIALGWLVRDAASDSAERALRTAVAKDRLHAKDPKTSSAIESLTSAVEQGERARRWDSANAELALLLCQAHLHRAASLGSAVERETFESIAAKWLVQARQESATLTGIPERVDGTR